MYKITIICVGKLKEKYWQQAESEYLKRLSIFAKVKIIEVAEEKINSLADKKRILKLEAEKILKKIEPFSIVVTLDVQGKSTSSEELAILLKKIGESGQNITFVIGGPAGIDQLILDKSKYVLSLSRLTFTHQIARILLHEQIYRVLTIINQKSYHY